MEQKMCGKKQEHKLVEKQGINTGTRNSAVKNCLNLVVGQTSCGHCCST